MTDLLLINPQTRQVRRIHERHLGESYHYDPAGATLLADLESLRLNGPGPEPGDFDSAALSAMTANIMLQSKH